MNIILGIILGFLSGFCLAMGYNPFPEYYKSACKQLARIEYSDPEVIKAMTEPDACKAMIKRLENKSK